MLQADIDQINALATTFDDVAAQIDAIDVRTAAQSVAATLPRTPLGDFGGIHARRSAFAATESRANR